MQAFPESGQIERMKPPRVSVLLPVRNGGRDLLMAVWSVLGQSFADWELLVLDDASTDDALSAIARVTDARVRVMRDASHLGLAARLNLGLDAARGEFIARMDHDDIAFPLRLQRQVEHLDHQRDIDLLGTRALVFAGGGNAMGLFPFRQRHEEICRHPWLGFYLPHPTWMGRVDWFRRHRYRIPESRRAEDQDLLLRSYTSSRFACLPEVLLGYRIGSAGIRKMLTAHVSAGRSQLREHLRRRRPGLALLGAGASIAKAAANVAKAAAGRTLYTAGSLKHPVDEEISTEWTRLWQAANAWADKASAAP